MPKKNQIALRPFHETIVNAISRCSNSPPDEIRRLLQLIKKTKIPKGHDEIIATINKHLIFPEAQKCAREIREAIASLIQQKETRLNELNTQVTAAIWAQEKAARETSRIEEEIAKLTSPASGEGRIARRGAVTAAIEGKDGKRAKMLAARFSSEKGKNPDEV